MLRFFLRLLGYEDDPISVSTLQRERRYATQMRQESEWSGWAEWRPEIAQGLRSPQVGEVKAARKRRTKRP